MLSIDNIYFNGDWRKVISTFLNTCKHYGDYHECLNFSYRISPMYSFCMSYFTNICNIDKIKAIYTWYKSKDSRNMMINEYFDEYKKCTDDTHLDFNSNYGIYAYSEYGLDKCIECLSNDTMTRQAMFCINNNNAMSDESIDKLCTNSIQFLIRDDKLIMNVQMRASNIITLLPYDSFMFCYWYFYVFNKLYNEHNMKKLKVNYINIYATSIHYYDENLKNIEKDYKNNDFINLFDNYKDRDFLNSIDKFLSIE